MGSKKILVVEDEGPLIEVITSNLKSKGFKVVTVKSAEAAFDYLKNNQLVDAIWLDHYLLGKENGLDLLAKLKKEGGEFNDIPIFVVSNTAGADAVQSYRSLGIQKYFTKSDHKLEDVIDDIYSHLESAN